MGLCWNCVVCEDGGRRTKVLVDFVTEFEGTMDIGSVAC